MPIVWLTRKRRAQLRAKVACSRLLGARSRPLPQRCVTVPVRSVRYRARQGVIRMFNFRGQNMKRLLLAGAALSVATAASAADMQARPYTKAPPPAVVSPAYNWSGFYIGVMGGDGWGTATRAAAVLAGERSAITGNSPAASSCSASKSTPPAPASRTASPTTLAADSWSREQQDQCVRKRDRPCRLRDGCGAFLRQRRLCVGQQQGHHFSHSGAIVFG